ncbi:MAG: mevalonate kinase [Candidatus Thermoplasmatota archaeon]|jgi:mevalonate kinase|nr:mevalonate kinase [Candidatus Thermoplasmatota archaeon]
MVSASSPAKAILFGEHAVVYGLPALAVSLDRRLEMTVHPSEVWTVDGAPLESRKHRYIRWGAENLWDGGPLNISTRSSIPSASGLGSSAALCCSLISCFLEMRGAMSPEELARKAFEVEYNVQGKASPTDTSCCTHGSAVLVSPDRRDDHLWSISKEERTWHVHHVPLPPMELVVGYTRTPSVTTVMVAKVRDYYQRSGFARETIEEIGQLTMAGLEALKKGDLVEVGALMDRNQALLSILGVSTKELKKLLDAAAPHSYGVKITGAGGGGSMIALTDRPELVEQAIMRIGGTPYRVRPSNTGTTVGP